MIGEFRNKSDQLISVIIGTDNNTIIGGDLVKFGEEPVVIEYSLDDSFQTIIKKQATINLVTKDYVGASLFSGNAREIPVLITNEDTDEVIFSGFLSPTTFNQPYNNYWDEFSLDALDFLGTLEYYNYKNTASEEDYSQNKEDADIVTFKNIIEGILPTNKVYYDKSKGLTNGRLANIFEDLSIPESLFYGEEIDDTWTQEDVLHEILQYLNLHIIQEGENFYIFDWDTIKKPGREVNEFLSRENLVEGVNFYIMTKDEYDLEKAKEIHQHQMIQLPQLQAGDDTYIYILTLDCNCGEGRDEGTEIGRYAGIWTNNGSSSWITNSSTPGRTFYSLYIPDKYCLYTLHGKNQKWDLTGSKKIFNNESWYNISTGTNTNRGKVVSRINSEKFADAGTSISIDNVYNQVSITCDVEDQETLIENPLDKKRLTSFYKGKQLYLTEIKSVGGNTNSIDPFNDAVLDRGSNDERVKSVNWFLQVMTNPNWKLHTPGGNLVDDLCEQDQNGNYINQWKIPKYLRDHQCTPAILRMGNYEVTGGNVKDNSPVNKVDMKDYLFISVNGNENDTEGQQSPSDSTLQNAAPLIEYTGTSGGVFSPPDDDTINYLVFSGKLIMQALQYETTASKDTANKNNNYDLIRQAGGAAKSSHEYASVPSFDGKVRDGNMVKTKDDQMYYTRIFYNQTKVNDKANTHLSTPSLQPWSNDYARGYTYNYSQSWDGQDRYSKVPVLECELIIGDKRLIETDIDEYGNSTFEWVKLGEEPTEVIDGVTYTQTTFSLGINPKIGDHIIGDEFDIQNTIDYTMNVDASGTAIPIKRENALTGKLTFRILGPVNTTWNDVLRRHKTWFHHSRFSENTRFILAHVENIVIKDFECKIYSNNGLYSEQNSDNDIIYRSAENDSFIDTKDDIDFKFLTQLTSKEAFEMGVSPTINLNSVLKSSDKLPLTCFYNENTQQNEGGVFDALTGETAKPEEHYINQYYNEYNTPRTLLELTLHEEGEKFDDLYFWKKLENNYSLMSRSRSIKNEISTLILKEL